MRFSSAALAVLAGVSAVAIPARAAELLTLQDAFTRVASSHPALRLFGNRADVLAAERDIASQRPPMQLAVDVENVLGTGEQNGVEQAELTVSLASVLERGRKLDARRTLVQSRIDALAIERETQRLDLLADVARRYALAVAARREDAIATEDVAQRKRAVSEARRRWQAGASPESVVFSAQAALARAEMSQARAQAQAAARRQHLAALWGERAPEFTLGSADESTLPALAGFAQLEQWLERTPEIARFADELRIGEARLRLARAEARADIDWQVGIRHFRDSNDAALIASASMPLGASRRAQPAIHAARAGLAGLEIERESAALALYSTLAEAHGRYEVARIEAARLHDEVRPRLAQAEQATAHAYRAGAASYLEWAAVQAEYIAAREEEVDAVLRGELALIEIQRLTGQPLLAVSGSPTLGAQQ
ncbi:TolC family protein [Lysobacter sp. H21R4]|uniref:TolC family protein n=1 Tax=Lysobacter sp. H21R4 TaxID=2781021 RepID=UPI00188785C2|nr:TolC family protein [Lysobacter sp. H21R4]QOY62439.1 TolC family protein [Lysobacter sp. H21R4]